MLIALPDGRARSSSRRPTGEGTYGLVGMELDLDHSKTGRVLERGRSERVDSVLDDPEVDQQAARRLGVAHRPLRPARRRAAGRSASSSRTTDDGPDPRFTDDDLRLAETLAARAAIAVDLSSASAATPCGGSSRRRSSSASGSPASCTTRRARR